VNPKRIPVRAVLFDWDGTLLDSHEADSRAYLAMFSALKIDWGLEELARHYSPDWHRVYRAARLPPSRWEEADRLWGAAYDRESPALLPGARRTIKTLGQQFVLGIVTGGNRQRVGRQLRSFELASYFSACVCCEDAPKRKPHPAPLEMAMARLRAKPEECVYVGDTPEDVQMAERAGVRAIGVLGPFPTAARIRAAKPEVLLDSIRELPPYLREMTNWR
jgi:HAD superfamily hydrolase (TIGR01509 family)